MIMSIMLQRNEFLLSDLGALPLICGVLNVSIEDLVFWSVWMLFNGWSRIPLFPACWSFGIIDAYCCFFGKLLSSGKRTLSLTEDKCGSIGSETNLVPILLAGTFWSWNLRSLGTAPLMAVPKKVGSKRILSSGKTIGSCVLRVLIVAEQSIKPMEVASSLWSTSSELGSASKCDDGYRVL